MSMPGMMDTILNLGLNASTLPGLIAQTQNERFGYDAYRRFIQLFGKVALGVPDELFDEQFDEVKRQAGVKADIGLNAEHLKDVSERFLNVVRSHIGKPFPEDVYEQLEIAIKAPVFPAETHACACPSRIASMAFHMLEPLPLRMA